MRDPIMDFSIEVSFGSSLEIILSPEFPRLLKTRALRPATAGIFSW